MKKTYFDYHICAGSGSGTAHKHKKKKPLTHPNPSHTPIHPYELWQTNYTFNNRVVEVSVFILSVCEKRNEVTKTSISTFSRQRCKPGKFTTYIFHRRGKFTYILPAIFFSSGDLFHGSQNRVTTRFGSFVNRRTLSVSYL